MSEPVAETPLGRLKRLRDAAFESSPRQQERRESQWYQEHGYTSWMSTEFDGRQRDIQQSASDICVATYDAAIALLEAGLSQPSRSRGAE